MRAILLLCAAAGLAASSLPAQAALFGQTGLDPAFCRTASVRQTVLYIDDMTMIDGRTDWARSLAVKLRATLSPGERLTVVRLQPAQGLSRELWSGCWPGYTSAQKATLQQGRFLFSRNPLADLDDQQKFFLGAMGAALTTIYEAGKRPADAVRIEAGRPPHKEIIRALASDEGRFSASQVTIRAIIYSDMAENSDLGSVFGAPGNAPANAPANAPGNAPANAPANAAAFGPGPVVLGVRLGTYLRRGVFYGFGVAEDVEGDPNFPETARRFWTDALHGMAATLAGMGADLNVPNLLPVVAHTYPVVLTMDNQPLEGKLSLLTDEDGVLVDSWIGISRLGSAGLDGDFHCDVASDSASDNASHLGGGGGGCRLDATTSNGLATSAPAERVLLKGPVDGPLVGDLGVRAQGMLFKLRTDVTR